MTVFTLCGQNWVFATSGSSGLYSQISLYLLSETLWKALNWVWLSNFPRGDTRALEEGGARLEAEPVSVAKRCDSTLVAPLPRVSCFCLMPQALSVNAVLVAQLGDLCTSYIGWFSSFTYLRPRGKASNSLRQRHIVVGGGANEDAQVFKA